MMFADDWINFSFLSGSVIIKVENLTTQMITSILNGIPIQCMSRVILDLSVDYITGRETL